MLKKRAKAISYLVKSDDSVWSDNELTTPTAVSVVTQPQRDISHSKADQDAKLESMKKMFAVDFDNETPEERTKRLRKEVISELISTESSFQKNLEYVIKYLMPSLDPENPNTYSDNTPQSPTYISPPSSYRETVFSTSPLANSPNIFGDFNLFSSNNQNNNKSGSGDWYPLTKEQFRDIFSDISDVMMTSQRLLRNLQGLDDLEEEEQNVGQMFEEMIHTISDGFTEYCCNLSKSMRIREELLLKKDFSRFIDHQMIKAQEFIGTRTNLDNLLIQPMQRICRYPLLLSELDKHTSYNHSDKESIMNAIGLIGDVIEEINKRQTTEEAQEARLSVLNRFSERDKMKDLNSPDRRLLIDGHCKKVYWLRETSVAATTATTASPPNELADSSEVSSSFNASSLLSAPAVATPHVHHTNPVVVRNTHLALFSDMVLLSQPNPTPSDALTVPIPQQRLLLNLACPIVSASFSIPATSPTSVLSSSSAILAASIKRSLEAEFVVRGTRFHCLIVWDNETDCNIFRVNVQTAVNESLSSPSSEAERVVGEFPFHLPLLPNEKKSKVWISSSGVNPLVSPRKEPIEVGSASWKKCSFESFAIEGENQPKERDRFSRFVKSALAKSKGNESSTKLSKSGEFPTKQRNRLLSAIVSPPTSPPKSRKNLNNTNTSSSSAQPPPDKHKHKHHFAAIGCFSAESKHTDSGDDCATSSTANTNARSANGSPRNSISIFACTDRPAPSNPTVSCWTRRTPLSTAIGMKSAPTSPGLGRRANQAGAGVGIVRGELASSSSDFGMHRLEWLAAKTRAQQESKGRSSSSVDILEHELRPQPPPRFNLITAQASSAHSIFTSTKTSEYPFDSPLDANINTDELSESPSSLTSPRPCVPPRRPNRQTVAPTRSPFASGLSKSVANPDASGASSSFLDELVSSHKKFSASPVAPPRQVTTPPPREAPVLPQRDILSALPRKAPTAPPREVAVSPLARTHVVPLREATTPPKRSSREIPPKESPTTSPRETATPTKESPTVSPREITTQQSPSEATSDPSRESSTTTPVIPTYPMAPPRETLVISPREIPAIPPQRSAPVAPSRELVTRQTFSEATPSRESPKTPPREAIIPPLRETPVTPPPSGPVTAPSQSSSREIPAVEEKQQPTVASVAPALLHQRSLPSGVRPRTRINGEKGQEQQEKQIEQKQEETVPKAPPLQHQRSLPGGMRPLPSVPHSSSAKLPARLRQLPKPGSSSTITLSNSTERRDESIVVPYVAAVKSPRSLVPPVPTSASTPNMLRDIPGSE